MRVLALVSGGLDSATLVSHLQAVGHDVSMLTIEHGQRNLEREQVAMFTMYGDVMTVRTVGWPAGGNALSDPSMELGSETPWVPARNGVIAMIGASIATAHKMDAVALGIQCEDEVRVLGDNDETFRFEFQLLTDTMLLNIEVLAPFATWKKAQVVRRARELEVKIEDTWSCYGAGLLHCGRCSACVRRRGALAPDDPTTYETIYEE